MDAQLRFLGFSLINCSYADCLLVLTATLIFVIVARLRFTSKLDSKLVEWFSCWRQISSIPSFCSLFDSHFGSGNRSCRPKDYTCTRESLPLRKHARVPLLCITPFAAVITYLGFQSMREEIWTSWNHALKLCITLRLGQRVWHFYGKLVNCLPLSFRQPEPAMFFCQMVMTQAAQAHYMNADVLKVGHQNSANSPKTL